MENHSATRSPYDKEGITENFDPELKRAFEFAHETVDPKLVDYSKIKMHKDSIKLSGDGTFYTLQGEGPTMGRPCVFVRLHVCNLRCTWCDAWYTWNPNTEEYWTEPRDVSFDTCREKIVQSWDDRNTRSEKRVVWTGGEPLIQRRQIESVSKLLDLDWINEIETNGTLMPTEYMLENFQFNCSPKLANSENLHHSMVKPKVLEALNKVDTTFKFVITQNSDLEEIEEKYLPYVDFDKVILMPQGVTAEEVHENGAKIAEHAKEKGFRVLGRLQNELWDGARRAV